MCPPDISSWSSMRYCFDLDGTICHTPCDPDGHNQRYWDSTPFPFMVETINRLYDEGNHIIIMTARGRGSGKDWTELTKKHLSEWGVKYNELEPMFHKPTADIFIDDKGIDVETWKSTQPVVKGILAGAFDLIHPGYIRMFKHSKQHCNHLTVALHADPTTERPFKLKPVQSVEDRIEILEAIKYVDNVVVYNSEEEFISLLKSDLYQVRFLGDDYSTGFYTGKDVDIPIEFVCRDHDYSTTKLKEQITQSLSGRIRL